MAEKWVIVGEWNWCRTTTHKRKYWLTLGIESPFFQKKFVRQKLNHCNVDADFNVDADAKMLMPRFSKDRRNLLTSECLLSGSTTPYKYRLLRYFPVPDHQFAENLILYFAFNKKKRRWKYNATNFTGFTISFSDKKTWILVVISFSVVLVIAFAWKAKRFVIASPLLFSTTFLE